MGTSAKELTAKLGEMIKLWEQANAGLKTANTDCTAKKGDSVVGTVLVCHPSINKAATANHNLIKKINEVQKLLKSFDDKKAQIFTLATSMSKLAGRASDANEKELMRLIGISNKYLRQLESIKHK